MRYRYLHLACFVVLWVSGVAWGQTTQTPAQAIRGIIKQAAGASYEDADRLLRRAGRLAISNAKDISAKELWFIEADIARTAGRAAYNHWRRHPKNESLRYSARNAFDDAIKKYESIVGVCDEEASGIERRLGVSKAEQTDEYRKLVGFISQANYHRSWATYHLAMTHDEGVDERKLHLNDAINGFIGFTARGYRNHPIISDCFLGQALCLAELGDHFQVTELLKGITPSNAPKHLVKRLTYVAIKAYQKLPSDLGVELTASRYFDSLPDGHVWDPVDLQIALDRAAGLARLADEKLNPQFHHSFKLRLDLVGGQIYRYGEPWIGKLTDLLGDDAGVSPIVYLKQATEYFEEQRYQHAYLKAEQGLTVAGSDGEPTVIADLSFVTAASYLNLSQWRDAFQAGKRFTQKYPRDQRAAEMAKRTLNAGLNALRGQFPVSPAMLLEYLAFVETTYPMLDDVARIPWYRGRLLVDMRKFDQAIEVLSGVAIDSPVFQHAQYGIALAVLRRRQSKGDEGVSRDLAAGHRAIDAFLAHATEQPKGSDLQQVHSGMLDVAIALANAYLKQDAVDPTNALKLIDRLERWPLLGDRQLTARLAVMLDAYVIADDADSAVRIVDHLLETQSKQAVDTVAARSLASAEAMFKRRFYLMLDGQTDRRAIRSEGSRLAKMYDVLIRYFQYSDDPARQTQEIGLRRRLARVLLDSGNMSRAALQYKWLQRRVPKDSAGDVYRGLAMTLEYEAKYKEALELWRTLARSVERESSDWFEARYHVIKCHFDMGDRDQALKLFDYLRLRHAKIKDPFWEREFQQLEVKLKQ